MEHMQSYFRQLYGAMEHMQSYYRHLYVAMEHMQSYYRQLNNENLTVIANNWWITV